MYIRRINKGGSLLVCENAPKVGTGVLASARRWRGQIYHVPSLKYILSEDAHQDDVDAVETYFSSLKVGDHITWDLKTEDPVFFTQDRHGNDLPEPRKSTRLYADIDLEELNAAITAEAAPAAAPAPARRTRGARA